MTVASTPIRYEDHVLMYQFDPVTGWYGRPNIETKYEAPDGALVTVRHNSLGNRDVERAAPKSAGRIAVIGGSLGWGMGVEFEDAYPRRLERALGREVFNYAHCNFGLDQCLITMKERVVRIGPEIVVLEQHPWVLYRLLLRYNKGYPKPYFWLDAQGRLRLRKLDPLVRFAPGRRLYLSYLQYLKEVEDEMSPADLLKNYRKTHDPMFSYLAQTRYNDLYKLARMILEDFAAFSKRLRIKVLVVLTSTLHQLQYEAPNLLFNYDIPSERLRATLTQVGLPYLDLHPVLDSTQRSGQPVIYRDDGHWNALGHRLASEAVATKLGQLGWV